MEYLYSFSPAYSALDIVRNNKNKNWEKLEAYAHILVDFRISS